MTRYKRALSRRSPGHALAARGNKATRLVSGRVDVLKYGQFIEETDAKNGIGLEKFSWIRYHQHTYTPPCVPRSLPAIGQCGRLVQVN